MVNDNQVQEKVAAVQDALFSKVYIPAYVQTYNEKAASIGIPPIRTQEELNQALALTEMLEHSKAAQAQENESPITATFNKVAQAQAPRQAAANKAVAFAKQAAQQSDVLSRIAELVK